MVGMADVPLRPPLPVTTYTAAIRTDADLRVGGDRGRLGRQRADVS